MGWHLSHGAVARRQVERAASPEDAARRTRKRVDLAVAQQDVDRGRVTLQAGPVERRHASAVCGIDVGPSLAQCTYSRQLAVAGSVMQRRAAVVVHGVARRARLQEKLKPRPVLLASELHGRCWPRSSVPWRHPDVVPRRRSRGGISAELAQSRSTQRSIY